MLFAGGLAGCGVLPYGAVANHEYHDRLNITRATTTVTQEELPPGRSIFVGVALSGGGSRADNFSAAALLELEALGLLDRATALSSVSGSSLTTAYYGLYGGGRDPRRWTRARLASVLRTNFEKWWIARWFLPQNIARYWLTQFDRTDIMKHVLDDFLFDDKTFAGLGAGLPKILINATRLSVGERMVFSDETLQALGSRLDNYPISHAVMASGAFPGAFQNVTLQDFSRQQRASTAARYEHLYDGGPSDNLGVMALLEMVRDLYKDEQRRPKACFLIIVDAYIDNPEKDVNRPDSRAGIDFIIDTNVIDASDALLSLRRRNILAQAGFEDIDIGRKPVQAFPVFGPGTTRPDLECRAWHLSFQRLLAWKRVEPKNVYDQFTRRRAPREEFQNVNHAKSIGAVINQISTRYKLTGLKDCSPEQLQQDLYEAARLLIREDRDSLHEVCSWFHTHGGTLPSCTTALQATAESRAPACTPAAGHELLQVQPDSN